MFIMGSKTVNFDLVPVQFVYLSSQPDCSTSLNDYFLHERHCNHMKTLWVPPAKSYTKEKGDTVRKVRFPDQAKKVRFPDQVKISKHSLPSTESISHLLTAEIQIQDSAYLPTYYLDRRGPIKRKKEYNPSDAPGKIKGRGLKRHKAFCL